MSETISGGRIGRGDDDDDDGRSGQERRGEKGELNRNRTDAISNFVRSRAPLSPRLPPCSGLSSRPRERARERDEDEDDERRRVNPAPASRGKTVRRARARDAQDVPSCCVGADMVAGLRGWAVGGERGGLKLRLRFRLRFRLMGREGGGKVEVVRWCAVSYQGDQGAQARRVT